jgi:hypothetical protein
MHLLSREKYAEMYVKMRTYFAALAAEMPTENLDFED